MKIIDTHLRVGHPSGVLQGGWLGFAHQVKSSRELKTHINPETRKEKKRGNILPGSREHTIRTPAVSLILLGKLPNEPGQIGPEAHFLSVSREGERAKSLNYKSDLTGPNWPALLKGRKMVSQPKDARIRLRLSPACYERMCRQASSRQLHVQDYIRLVVEGHEEDFTAFHAYNASRHATMTAFVLMVYLQITANKNFNPDVLKDIGKHVHAVVGDGPGKPTLTGEIPNIESDVFVEGLMAFYGRFVVDRFPDMRPKA